MTPRTTTHLITLIAAREGWMCWRCGNVVDRTLRYPDPMSGSVDHVTDLARGGTDDPANLRLAHLSCNTSAGGKSVLARHQPRTGFRGRTWRDG